MNKEDAAKALGVSVRTLQRMTKQGEVSVKYERGKKGDEAVYDDEEIAQLAQKRSSGAFLQRATPDATDGTALQRREQFAGLLELLQQNTSQPSLSDLDHKVWLTKGEAIRLSGISSKVFDELVTDGVLIRQRIGRNGSFVVKRSQLLRVVEDM
jgi:hypothetical protein